MNRDDDKNRSETLAEEGYALIEDGDYEGALAIAKELEGLRYTASFEIEALALAGQDKLEEAVAALERGVKAAPREWLNWQLLGNYRSDLEDYGKAADAYERALRCPDVDADSVRLNQAILANRRGDHAAALLGAEALEGTELELEAAEVRITALKELGRATEALALAEELLSEHVEGSADSEGAVPESPDPWKEGVAEEAAEAWMEGDGEIAFPGEGAEGGIEEEVDDPDDDALARIAAARGRILFERDGASEALTASILDSARQFRTGTGLLALLRDMEAAYSPKARYYRLIVEAIFRPDHPGWDGVRGYWVEYDVVADSPAAALERVRALEGAHGASLRVEKMEDLEPRPDEPMGIYYRSGRMLYGDDEEEEG